MPSTEGLRERKKRETRHRLADVAARLFAERGYDRVSMLDVADAADVSEQTVYNYFATKPELVLDRAEEIRERLGAIVRDRPPGTTPAGALRTVVHEDVARFAAADPTIARGEFPVQCLISPVLRRFAFETRHAQGDTIAEAMVASAPTANPVVLRAHAAALVSVLQTTTDRIGAALLDGSDRDRAAREMRADADLALDDLDDHFRHLSGADSDPEEHDHG